MDKVVRTRVSNDFFDEPLRNDSKPLLQMGGCLWFVASVGNNEINFGFDSIVSMQIVVSREIALVSLFGKF